MTWQLAIVIALTFLAGFGTGLFPTLLTLALYLQLRWENRQLLDRLLNKNHVAKLTPRESRQTLSKEEKDAMMQKPEQMPMGYHDNPLDNLMKDVQQKVREEYAISGIDNKGPDEYVIEQ